MFSSFLWLFLLFFFNATATTEIYTLSLHDALPISGPGGGRAGAGTRSRPGRGAPGAGGLLQLPAQRRSEEHTSELQSLRHLVCRLLLEKKKKKVKRFSRLRSGADTIAEQ